MDDPWKAVLWSQLGGSIDMLENAIDACPEALWGDRSRNPEFWYVVYHTLFFLDYYLSDSLEDFVPPAPFNLDELDPAGVMPERVYTKEEMRGYLHHGRAKARGVVAGLTDETAREHRRWASLDCTLVEVLLGSMRHVQHHTAQLNLILRQTIDSAPRWVARAREG